MKRVVYVASMLLCVASMLLVLTCSGGGDVTYFSIEPVPETPVQKANEALKELDRKQKDLGRTALDGEVGVGLKP